MIESKVELFVGSAFQSRIPTHVGTFVIVEISARLPCFFAHKWKFSAANTKTEAPATITPTFARLSVSAAAPERFDLDFFGRHNGDLITPVTVEPGMFARKPTSDLTEEQLKKFLNVKQRTESAWHEIKIGYALELDNYAKVISRLAEVASVDRTTLARDMARFFWCGLDANSSAMMSLFSRAATNATRLTARNVTKKLGRPRKEVASGHDPQSTGENTHDRAKANLARFLSATKDREGRSEASLFNEYITKHGLIASHVMADGFVVMIRDPQLSMTADQFRYHKALIESEKYSIIKRVGGKNFNLRYRPLLSHARDRIGFPGQCYIIDSTVIDVYCVSAINRRYLIGRPIVYLVIDAFSQLVMSVHVALEGPNMNEARVAVYRAVTDKGIHFQTLGVRGCANAYVHGVRPLTLFSDRGELLSQDGRNMSELYNIAQSLAAAYRADWKAYVERMFKIANDEVVHWMPGAVRARARERGSRDRRHDAVLTTNELHRVLITMFARWNLTKDMSDHVSCEMIRHEIDATPIEFWNYGLQHLNPGATKSTREEAVIRVLKPIEVDAKRDGITVLQHLRFTSPWMNESASYFDMIGSAVGSACWLDPDRPLGAYVLDPSSNTLHQFGLVDKRGYKQEDVSICDVLLAEQFEEFRRTDDRAVQEVISDSLHHEVDQIIVQATEATKAAQRDDTRSKSAKIKGIRENRVDEVTASLGLANPSNNAVPALAAPSEMDAKWGHICEEDDE